MSNTMFTYTKQQINQKKTFSEVERRTFQIIEEINIPDAFYLAYEINEHIKAGNISKALSESYLILAGQLMCLSLSRWPEQSIIDLFQTNIATSITNVDIDIVDALRTALSFIDLDKRDDVRRRLVRSLEQNQEQLTSTGLVQDGATKSGIISNWLADFREKFGGGLSQEIERARYFGNDKNVVKLSLQEKQAIQRLLSVYDYLKLSSLSQLGFEESYVIDDGSQLKVFDSGNLYVMARKNDVEVEKSQESFSIESQRQPVQNTQQQTSEEQEILAAYRGPEKDRQAIAREQEKLQKKLGGNLDAYGEALVEAVQKKKSHRAIAALYSLAEMEYLMPYVLNNKKLTQQLVKIWEQQYGKQFADEFTKNATQPEYVRAFLRYVLENRLQLESSFAAWVGAQISNIFVSQGKKEYNTIAYFDVRDKKFEWFEV